MVRYLTMNGYDWKVNNLDRIIDANVFAILWGGGTTTSVIGNYKEYDDNGYLGNKLKKYYLDPLPLKA